MEGDSPPTWSQHTSARLRSTPPLFNPVMLILLIPILILIIIFLIIPPLIYHTSNIFKPNSVKKGWDSLNMVLVVIAILCGVFGRRNNDSSATVESTSPVKSEPSESSQWYEYSDQRVESSGGSRLRRTSSSYPDLRQAPEWETGYNQFRFFDDFELNRYSSPPPLPPPEYHRDDVQDNTESKVIPVDTFKVVQSPPLVAAVVVESTPPVERDDLSPRRSFHSLPKNYEKTKIQSEDSTLLPNEKRPGKSHRRKSGSAKEIADSVYSERKRKRKHRIRNSYEKKEQTPPRERSFPPPTPPPQPPPPPPSSFYDIFKNKKGNKNKKVHSLSAQRSPPTPPPLPPSPRSMFNNMFKSGSKSKRFHNQSTSAPPPPPPPPPPSSIFNNLFKNGSKIKRLQNHSTSAPPPPPPPLPQGSIFNNIFKSSSKSKRFHSTTALPPPRPKTSIFAGRPPLPEKTRNFYYGNDIPVPPPLPPFRMREKSFAPRGDFVKIRSTYSSCCSSPELEDIDLVLEKEAFDQMDGGDRSGSTSEKMDGGDGSGIPVMCPSPDVNTKADSFIARLKGEWRLEKINSIREKNMGPKASE